MSDHFPSNLYGWSPSPSPHKCVAQERWYTLGFRHGRDNASNAAGEVPAEFRGFYRLGFRDGGWRAQENRR